MTHGPVDVVRVCSSMYDVMREYGRVRVIILRNVSFPYEDYAVTFESNSCCVSGRSVGLGLSY